MKVKSDPRHQKRINMMQDLYAWDFQKDTQPNSDSTKKIIEKISEIDQLITQSAPNRPLDQINRIDLAILRLAVFELVINPEAPLKVVIDEAVELSKEFGSEASPSFVNGALGNLVTLQKLENMSKMDKDIRKGE